MIVEWRVRESSRGELEEVIEKGKGRKASREDGERVIERGGGGSYRKVD